MKHSKITTPPNNPQDKKGLNKPSYFLFLLCQLLNPKSAKYLNLLKRSTSIDGGNNSNTIRSSEISSKPTRGPKLSHEKLRDHLIDQGLFDLSKPIVLFNANAADLCARAIPDQLLAATGESLETVQRAIATPEELAPFSLSLNERSRFKRGEPLLIWPGVFEHLEKRSTGGQANGVMEQTVKRALAVTTFAVVERVRHLQSIRDKCTHLTEESSRDGVLKELTQHWPEDDARPAEAPQSMDDLSEIDTDSDGKDKKRGPRRKHLETLYDRGRRSSYWQDFFASANLKKELRVWSTRFARAKARVINKEIDFQKSQVLALLYCEARAVTLRKMCSAISDAAAKDREETPRQRSVLSGFVLPDRRRGVADVLPAAFAGDINPADLFLNLENAREHFETMRIIGRFARGLPAAFTHRDMLMLVHPLKLLERWTTQPWPECNAADKEQAFWARAMKAVMPLDEWQRFFHQGYPMTQNSEDFVVKRKIK